MEFPFRLRLPMVGSVVPAGNAPAKSPIMNQMSLLTVLLFHPSPPITTTLWAFPVTRIIDILKIPPARRLERLPAGWGVLADDLLGSVYAAAALHLLRFAGPAWF